MVALLVVTGLAAGLSLAQQKQYSATASLLFRDPGFDQKLFGSSFLPPSENDARNAATNVELISLEGVADRTAEQLDGPVTGPQIHKKIEVTPKGQSDLVAVTATDQGARFAAGLANTFAEQYIRFRREADRSKIREAQQLVQSQLTALDPSERQGPRGRSLVQRAGELEVLASLQTGNAELVQPARVPTTASSPRTIRNVGLGAVAGLLIGLGLAFAVDRFDRRLRDPKEVESIFERPILGTVPTSRAIAGAGPATQSLSNTDAESFRMLRANLRYFNVDRDVRSVLVTSAAPGDGKSTVAWNLAIAAAGGGTRVLLIEADLRHPSLSESLGMRQTAGLSELLAGAAEFEDVVREVPVGTQTRQNGGGSPTAIHVLFAGLLPPNPTDLIESARMRQLLHGAERNYDFVVVDTPPTSVVSDAIPLVTQVGGVIVVARLSKSTREAARHLHSQLVNLQAPVLGVVVNSISSDADAYGYGYSYGDRHSRAGGAEKAEARRTFSSRS